MSKPMTPERIRDIKLAIETGDLCHAHVYECLDEIERLRTLPPDLEKRLGEIEAQIKEARRAWCADKYALVISKVLIEHSEFLITTIRALQAELTKEWERARYLDELCMEWVPEWKIGKEKP